MTHVLIVEDHAENRDLLKLLLEVNGYRVTTAGDGVEALAAARRDPPDVVVSDALMPKMDGFALCRAWMQDAALKAIPFIFYSATYVRPDDEQFAAALGAVRYLIKPLEAKVFLAELGAVLQQWAGRAAPAPAPPLDELASHALHASALARKLEDKVAQLEAANRKLQESEARFRSLTEMSSDFYWESDAEHRLTLRTAAAKKASAVPAFERGAQIGDRRWEIPYLSPDAAGWAAHRAVLEAHQPFRDFVLSRLGLGGTERFISISGDPVFDAFGAFTGYRGVGADVTERKQFEADLRASEERWKFALEGAGDGVWDRNLQTGEVRYSARWKEMLGYADGEISAHEEEWLSRIHPDDLPRVMADVRACTDGTRATYANERRMRCRDGSWLWVLARGKVVSHSPDGRPLRMIGTHTDITERKRAEEALRESEVQLKGILESTADGILAVDSKGKVIRANRRFAEMWRISEPLLNSGDDQALLDFVLGQLTDPDAFVQKVRALYASDAEGQDVLAFKDGRIFERHSAPLLLDAAILGRVWSFRDVTERKRVERTLEQNEKRFRGLIEQSLTGVYVILMETGVFQYANPRLEQLLGYGPGELVGIRTDDIVVAEDMPIVVAERDKLRAGARSSFYEVRALRKDGTVIELGVTGSSYDLEGQEATVGMAQDITEKKRAEGEIKRYVAELETAFMSTVNVATTLGEMRDPYTAGHQRRVAEIAVAIGAELGFDAHRQEGLRVAGYLHDIGKITIPAEILSKPGKLSPLEYTLIQGHAQSSYDVLKGVQFPWPVAEVARQHHERVDGSGYPQGLKGEAILLEARIIGVADVIEAMSSHRPYRPGLGMENALAEIERGRGSAYDAGVIDACLRLFRDKGYTIPT